MILKFSNQIFRFVFIGISCVNLFSFETAYSQLLTNPPLVPQVVNEEKISQITVKGNKTVTTQAILNSMLLKDNSVISDTSIRKDIKSIYATGYFQDVQIKRVEFGKIEVEVTEKPTINEIQFEGFDAVTSTSLKDKFVTKQYSIIDEKKISQDLRTIEQAYIEKGYYLAKASYILQEVKLDNVNLIFKVSENSPIAVRNVTLIGNEEFSDADLANFMATKQFSWSSFFSSSGIYKDEFINADQQNLTYFYRDNGFAEATVAAPISILNKNKTDINVSFYIQQGEKYKIGKIQITGDILNTEEDIKKHLTLNEGDLYKISKFNLDLKLLKLYYGDKGYAFAYVYPKIKIDRKTKEYDIIYNITKGEKAYIRNIIIEGNLKTRDNVIRRALRISEGEIFNSSKIELSKNYINRLGFFDNQVDLIQEPDLANNAIDLRIAIKEKSTGSLNASLGASPNSNGGSGVTFFGSIQYDEKNFLGKGYGLGTNIQVSPSPKQGAPLNYTLGLNFTNPSVFDGLWSFSANVNYQKIDQDISVSSAIDEAYLTQDVLSSGLIVGREIFDNFRLMLGYSISRYNINPIVPLTAKFYQSGNTEEFSQRAVYDVTNNYVNPTSGYSISLLNSIAIRTLFGEFHYGLVSANFNYYIPLNITENFTTNFRIAFSPKIAYQTRKDEPIPYWKRLKLGNAYQMKGYENTGETISPTIPVTISPTTGQTVDFSYGGDQSYYGVVEYFIPLVPEAGLRLVAFGEVGTVLSEQDTFSMNKLKYDIGFGFRWVTPVAPFRFEWAFPVENGRVGKAHFVFTIGYDNVDS